MEKEPTNSEWLKKFATIVFCTLIGGGITWLFPACSDDKDVPVSVKKVLLVYLAGDNNLSYESRQTVDCLVHGFDGNPQSRILIYRDDHSAAPSLLEISSKGQTTTLATYNQENSADTVVFSRIITEARSLYPQAKFNLLVFSHGSGWLPQGAYSDPALRSIITDGEDEMEFTDFAATIPNGMFECIFFETCHMAGIETAYELKDKTKYVAASSAEILSPGFIAIYEKQVHNLLNDDPRYFMQAVFDYFDNQIGYMRSATFSVIATQKLDALAAYVQAHCDFSKEVPIDEIQYFDRYNLQLFCDFGDLYSHLLQTQEQKKELQALIDDCVVWKASTPYFLLEYGGFAVNKHSGLTSYTMQHRYPKLNEKYACLNWYKRLRN